MSICTPWKVSNNSEWGWRESPRSQKLQTKGLTGISGVVGDSNQNTLHEGGGYTRVFFKKGFFFNKWKTEKESRREELTRNDALPFSTQFKATKSLS